MNIHETSATADGRTYTQADLLEAVKTERHACSIAVWMTLQDALEPDADDKGLDGWMREAEQRVKNRLAHHGTDAAAPLPPVDGDILPAVGSNRLLYTTKGGSWNTQSRPRVDTAEHLRGQKQLWEVAA